MAILTNEQRTEVWSTAMQWLSSQGISVSLTKAQVADIINLIDDGAGQSVGMIDAFIGAEYAAALDAHTKYALFAMVVQRRIQEGI